MLLVAGLGAKARDGEMPILTCRAPGKAQGLLEAHRGTIVLVHIIQISAPGAIDQRPKQALVVVRTSKGNHPTDITPSIAPSDPLQEAAHASRRLREYDSVDVPDVYAD